VALQLTKYQKTYINKLGEKEGKLMLTSYIPIAIQLIFAIGFAAGVLWLTSLIGPKKHNPVKDDAFECGVDYFQDARNVFNVKFYIVAVLFILFDVEVVFMVPWAVSFLGFKETGNGLFLFIEMVVFVAILLAGYIYIIKKGVLEWE